MSQPFITILGAGSMGTALAQVAARNGFDVRLWSVEKDVLAEISRARKNSKYLPDIDLSPHISAVADLRDALRGAHAVIFAVPSFVMRDVVSETVPYLAPRSAVLSVAKGLDKKSGYTMDELLSVLIADRSCALASLAGPLFAAEIANNIPSAGVIASDEKKTFSAFEKFLSSDALHLEFSRDVRGVEWCAVLKNVYAILLGVCDGLCCGFNTKAFFLTRAVSEMSRVIHSFGGRADTAYGLAGLGDLATTGFGSMSRNRRFGAALCSRKSLEKIKKEIGQAIEGLETLETLKSILKKKKIHAPFLDAIYALVEERQSASSIIKTLLSLS